MTDDETPERGLGLGPKSASMLRDVGVATIGDLRALGAAEAFIRVKIAHPAATLNLLWGIEGALMGIPWREIAPERKAELRRAVADVL